jgi:hypothetical protein
MRAALGASTSVPNMESPTPDTTAIRSGWVTERRHMMREHHTTRTESNTVPRRVANKHTPVHSVWGGRLGIGTARLHWCIPPGGAP